MVEAQRLRYIRYNQGQLRTDLYNCVQEAVQQGKYPSCNLQELALLAP
jgi:hypothetical protein